MSNVPDALSIEEGDDAVLAHLQDRPELTGGHCGRGTGAFECARIQFLRRWMAENRASGKKAARPVRYRGAIECREAHEDARIQICDRPTFKQMKEMPPRRRFRSIFALVELPDGQIETVRGRHQLRYRCVRITNHGK
jgi:hypothetical protein